MEYEAAANAEIETEFALSIVSVFILQPGCEVAYLESDILHYTW